MRGLRNPLLAMACVATALGCGDSTLAGSVSELFPLSVSNIAIQRNSEAFQVTYLHNQPTAVDIVASLGVALTGEAFVPGATLALDGEYAPGHPRCTVVHHADGEPERTLPPVAKGTFHLASGGNPGESTSGSFSLSFQGDAGDYGAGRTLYGSFSGLALDAGF